VEEKMKMERKKIPNQWTQFLSHHHLYMMTCRDGKVNSQNTLKKEKLSKNN